MMLGDIIINYRNSFTPKMSQRDFGKKCGLSHTYIAALEKNIDPRTNKPISPTLDTIKFVSKGLDISIEELLKMLDDEQEFKVKEKAPKYDNYIEETIKKYGLSSVALLENYSKLNELGKQKANENVHDLTKIHEYTEKKGIYEANG